jgi:hypothetical protein
MTGGGKMTYLYIVLMVLISFPVLTYGDTYSGRVYLKDNSHPATQALVAFALDEGEIARTITDDAGFFFIQYIPKGTYVVRVTYRGITKYFARNVTGHSDMSEFEISPLSAQVQIDFPKNGDSVGKVCLITGQALNLAPRQHVFVVIHSTAFGKRVYPQGEIIPRQDGKWSVKGVFGTPGYKYRTYVVMTENSDSALKLSDNLSKMEGLKDLPSETEIISPIIDIFRTD